MGLRRNAGLNVIGVHDRLGDVGGLIGPKYGPVRPGVRSVDDDAVAVIAGVLDDDGGHLLQNALGDFVLLRRCVVAGVLYRALQSFLLVLDLLH